MFLKLLALLLCITYAACDDYIQFKPCENTTAHSKNVRVKVSDCTSEDERCVLINGKNYTVTILFEPTQNFANKTDFKVHGVFPKFSVPYGKRGDACNASVTTSDGAPCLPTQGFIADQEYKHVSIFAVSNSYPAIELGVRFSAYDRRYKTLLFCVEVKIKIQPPSSSENEA